MIKIFFGACLNFLLFLFSYLVPKKRGLYLFGSRWGNSFAENSKYVYLYANKQKTSKKFVWITNSKEVIKTLEMRKLPVVARNSFLGFWSILRSEKIIFSSGTRDIAYFSFLLGNFKLIELWHGSPVKSIKFSEPKTLKEGIVKWGLRKQYSKYVFVLHTCNKTKDLIESAFLTKKIEILGYPRNDGLFNPTSFEKLPELDKYKKILFYMPTFRDNKSSIKAFSKKGLLKLNNILKKTNSILLIKKHFAEKNWESLDNFTNIKNISRLNDAYELLPFVDILITDYSSVCYDFSILGKSMIFYPYDYDGYILKSREMALDYYNDLPGPFVHTEKKLIALIENLSWERNKKYQKKLETFKRQNNKYLDNLSSSRVYNEIIKN